MDPVHCAAVHLNMISVPTPPQGFLQFLVGGFFPDWVLDKKDQEKILPASRYFINHLQQTGYMHLQATRPYSLAQGLSDSPAGLAAYISEKFAVWSDCNGDIYKRFTKDQLLTNIMVYWVTNTISSSVLFYKESFPVLFTEIMPEKIDFPVALAEFPVEVARQPKSWAESYFTNLISYTEMPSGGHFAAMEEPLLLAKDLWNYNKLVKL